jgi:type I restriction enzyme, S subunit
MNTNWLQCLPKSWQSVKLKSVVELKSIRENGSSLSEKYVGLENIEPWTGRLLSSSTNQVKSDQEESESKGMISHFSPGDTLFGKLRPYLAKAYLAQESGVCTTELLVMKPSKNLDGKFLLRVILTREFIETVNAETFGVKMPRADWNTVSNIVIPLPPLSQQRKIADYLDRTTQSIDSLIAAKKRLLELLAEKRRSIITQAVTHGLTADVPMKDSGIEWLGSIPKGWKVERIKFLLFGIEGGISPQCYGFPPNDGEWGVLKTGCVNGGTFNPSESKTLPEDVTPPLELEVREGDVLMSRASGSIDLVGAVALVTNQPKARLLLSDKTFRLNLNLQLCDASFFVAVMGSSIVRQQIHQVISGAEGLANNIAQSDIRELTIPLPPLSEQKEIIKIVMQRTRMIDHLFKTSEEAIALLQERRTSLISAAVTGQLQIPD